MSHPLRADRRKFAIDASDLISPFTILLVFGSVVTVWLLAGILAATGGHLVYTMDDPYIALALSEAIADGQYGINVGESVSPSSSILFPFLLAPAAGTSFHIAMPLLLSVGGSVLSFWAMARIADISGLAVSVLDRLIVGAILFGITLSINFYGIVFNGLEHALHVAASLLILAGLISAVENNRTPAWLLAAIVLATLFRFEGIVASVAALLVLICIGAWRKAAVAGLVLAGCLSVYFAAMVSLGLSPLPNSVLAKSSVASAATIGQFSNALQAVTRRLTSLAELPPARLLLGLAALAIAEPFLRAIFARRTFRSRDLLIPGFVATVTVGHALGGNFFWLDRYEIYALATGFVGLMYVYRHVWRWLLGALATPMRRPLPFAVGLSGLAAIAASLYSISGPYLRTTLVTAPAAYNIYEQQGQMSRFVREFYRAPVAVNDLGYVAWRNPDYVLDLVGLGSEDVWQAKRTGQWPDRLPELVRRHYVGLAMVYHWLDRPPMPRWTPMAYLRLGTPRVSPADATVTFLRTEEGSEEKIGSALRAFAETLPKGAILDVWPECGERVSIGDLSAPFEDGAAYDAAGVHQFRCPLTVEFERPAMIAGVEFQADNNDYYRLRLMLDGKETGLVETPPVPAAGLRTRDLEFPPVMADSIIVEGFGDHHYSVGLLKISER